MEIVEVDGVLYDVDRLPNGAVVYLLHATEEMERSYRESLEKKQEENIGEIK